MAFEKNVFINCPFDDQYLKLLRPLLFTVIYLGFTPRIALEALDSGEPRIKKILDLIEDSKYGIHDLSRMRITFIRFSFSQPKTVLHLSGWYSTSNVSLPTIGLRTVPED
jgi:hypothetical protein